MSDTLFPPPPRAYVVTPTPYQRKHGATHEIEVVGGASEQERRRVIARLLRRAKKIDPKARKWQCRVILFAPMLSSTLVTWVKAQTDIGLSTRN